jgi:uncharacterized membrane protein YphA (DoxX/SURF4 family)
MSSLRHPLRRGQPWLSLAARLLLAGFWIWAGASKLGDLDQSVTAVRAYRLLPDPLEPIVGAALPMVEIALGAMLLLGFAVRLGGVVSALLQVTFLIGIVSAAARGLRIDCGCFGGGGELTGAEPTEYTREIARDAGLLLVAAALALWPASRLSLDGPAAGCRDAA